jgi:hypothetical protein
LGFIWRWGFGVCCFISVLPISVLVPTRNSMSLLPKHVESMCAWLDLAQEIIAVDSESTDGTSEFLQRELKHPTVRMLTHPPGLYQSWNFGIAQCQAKYIYISTVGETITRAGLKQLFAVAERFNADVAISPPCMVRMSGEKKEKTWPIHTLIEELQLKADVVLDSAAVELFAAVNLLRGILGSSASNLYRGAILQKFPFRTDFGTAGDLAWGLEHAAHMRLAVVPQSFSTFLFHPKSYAKSDYAVEAFADKCLRLAQSAIGSSHGMNELSSSRDTQNLVAELLTAWERHLDDKRVVTSARRSSFWWLFPSIWQAYRRRSQSFAELTRIQQTAFEHLRRRLPA